MAPTYLNELHLRFDKPMLAPGQTIYVPDAARGTAEEGKILSAQVIALDDKKPGLLGIVQAYDVSPYRIIPIRTGGANGYDEDIVMSVPVYLCYTDMKACEEDARLITIAISADAWTRALGNPQQEEEDAADHRWQSEFGSTCCDADQFALDILQYCRNKGSLPAWLRDTLGYQVLRSHPERIEPTTPSLHDIFSQLGIVENKKKYEYDQ